MMKPRVFQIEWLGKDGYTTRGGSDAVKKEQSPKPRILHRRGKRQAAQEEESWLCSQIQEPMFWPSLYGRKAALKVRRLSP